MAGGASKSANVHLVCYHVHHIRNVQRCSFVALRMPSFSKAEAEYVAAGNIERSAGGGSITTS